ncbi:MAG: hypothetical protein M3Z23_04645 [Acidobacteriota bacterium]|nr:hypothetical protein [Acidobacteriota bacterium]
MNRHLSPEQFSGWLLGERQPELENHVNHCPACQTEAAQLANALAAFRGAVRESSAARFGSGFQVADRKPGRAWLPVNTVWAGAAVSVLLAIAGVSALPHARRGIVPENAITDAVLLSRIETELSRAVPCPMEPLTKLVAWQGSPSESK